MNLLPLLFGLTIFVLAASFRFSFPLVWRYSSMVGQPLIVCAILFATYSFFQEQRYLKSACLGFASVGMLMNMAVLLANGWHMPYVADALPRDLAPGFYLLADSSTPLAHLADQQWLRGFSYGDLLIMSGWLISMFV